MFSLSSAWLRVSAGALGTRTGCKEKEPPDEALNEELRCKHFFLCKIRMLVQCNFQS